MSNEIATRVQEEYRTGKSKEYLALKYSLGIKELDAYIGSATTDDYKHIIGVGMEYERLKHNLPSYISKEVIELAVAEKAVLANFFDVSAMQNQDKANELMFNRKKKRKSLTLGELQVHTEITKANRDMVLGEQINRNMTNTAVPTNIEIKFLNNNANVDDKGKIIDL